MVVAILALLATFAAITGGVIASVGRGADRSVLLALRTMDTPSGLIGPAWLPETARNLTSVGSITLLTIVIAISAVGFFITNRTVAACRMLAAFFGAIVLLNLLKWGIARPRPDFVVTMGEVFTNSFPSGHATLSAATYFTLAAILRQITSDRRLGTFIVLVSLALTFGAGLSRVYLGLHYASDVLAGWCLGSAWALCCGLLMSNAGATGRTLNAG